MSDKSSKEGALTPHCGNCFWWAAEPEWIDGKLFEDDVGKCHRYPPVVSVMHKFNKAGEHVEAQYAFPVVMHYEWCGEFKMDGEQASASWDGKTAD